MAKVAIIGGKGKMGRLFVKAFRKQGHTVVVASRTTKLKPSQAAAQADLVIITVPIRDTVNVIKSVGKHVRKGAILTDFTSVKVKPCQAMKKYSKANVVGSHPVFGPSVGLKGQQFVLCPVRGSHTWYAQSLKKMGLNVSTMTPRTHDKHMAIVQCLTHMSNFTFAHAMKQLHYKPKGVLTSPIYRIKLAIARRALDAPTELYTDIETENPYAKQVAKAYKKATDQLEGAIRAEDKKGVARFIEDCQKHFGKLTTSMRDKINKLVRFL
ncbi:MAG: prephenate dehydrogenase/arogenate dehydrogenase family protein [Candidatus Woesearchaeota archaeon]|jgi:prephenate dehydrogenase|nr:prephenate dehydrogenase/arogenate dehydrogenase family protein [Candidatus Woesearchaeota archaeon]MDP7181151.1 prephenate dehydrogenase/arogenate dehydrogenase family protein [Candidatus Woesearchaeota archaeon]MDP7198228.1 prephenate dehydrogenase/arogenate dehydrogenase family protein [Candidatus Woesearchaeota archaeon]MDP7467064.1 prephenate dehydrogenase/arogenate dehydrogenase family protein [Candidatus Woesearchaeota archaeon]MDP7646732.1 prephenate dehydrogenase/arogenate dehydroge